MGKHVPAKTEGIGQEKFVELLDEICRVYCDQCFSPDMSPAEFKKAGQELLDYLFSTVPKSGINLAAQTFLTKEFMDSVAQC